MSQFEIFVSGHHFYYIISEYLSIDDIINCLLINKNFCFNQTNRKYSKRIIEDKIKLASNKISIFMTKYCKYVKYINYVVDHGLEGYMTQKMNAIYYYQNYEAKYINDWFNIKILHKKHIISKYNKYICNNYKRIHLYNTIKSMPIKDSFYIGW